MNLVIFGCGYSGQAFARRVAPRFDRLVGTVRTPAKAIALARDGIVPRLFDGSSPGASPTIDPALTADIAEADAVLVSIAPDDERSGAALLRRGSGGRAAAALDRLSLHRRRVWRP